MINEDHASTPHTALGRQAFTRRRALQLGGLAAVAGVGFATAANLRPAPAHAGTIFREDFDGPWGSSPNRGRWTFERGYGNNGWGNNEWQDYTDRRENVMVNGAGILVITGRRNGDYWSSARMHTANSFAFRYGWAEATMILPRSSGAWPAFWLMPRNAPAWPNGGEIDIMERRGWEPGTISGALHGPGWSAGQSRYASYSLPGGQSFSDGWHSFAIRKEPGKITWYCDYREYFSVSRSQVPNWPFDSYDYYPIINMAIGGNLGGDATKGTWPQELLVNTVVVNDS